MVALDSGIYALTDEYGRYHFPAVEPGHRLVKINIRSLADAAEATTSETVVVNITPGILAKANFGVLYQPDTLKTGKPAEPGISMRSEAEQQPVEVLGNAESLTLLINGERAATPNDNVRLLVENMDEVVELKGNRLDRPITFSMNSGMPTDIESWKLKIMNPKGGVIHTIKGNGRLPQVIRWNGRIGRNRSVVGGEVYQYQLEARHADGTRSTSAKKLFGINQTNAISVNLTGEAFISGSAVLSEKARSALKETAAILRKYPDEKIIIEGHTDNVGTDAYNMELSKNRAMAALAQLVKEENLPEDRFVVRWYGESRPVTSNAIEETRALNRRIEIKGQLDKVERSKVFDQYRTEAAVTVNGEALALDDHGRFATRFEDLNLKKFDVQVINSRGQSFDTSFTVPNIEILKPTDQLLLPYGARSEEYKVAKPNEDPQADLQAVLLTYHLEGVTEPGNRVEIDGTPLRTRPDGTFDATLELKRGSNPFGLLVRNPDGITRILNLIVTVNDRDETGQLILATEPIPNLMVQLPPRGVPLTNPMLTIIGVTDPGNRVLVNDAEAAVAADGSFSTVVKLPMGDSDLVVSAVDPAGRIGTITRRVQVKDTHLFFLAFADGKMGLLKSKGFLEAAGAEEDSEFFTEGRLAFYLKGVIRGKYLVTAALDTGRDEFGNLFKDLDDNQSERLLTNLDPDKIYPVYGDSSTVVYDTDSRAKLYLAVDSDEFNLLLGNYQLSLTDTELAAYQRTLFGVNVAYQSVSKTKYGSPDTKVAVFGAEVKQVHISDQLRATGGSLYYLSRRQVIEGSEQVDIVIRDKNTGLVLSRQPQQQNVDYTIKYDSGRVLFARPIASVVEDDGLINQDILPGNPVFIEIDYEAREDSFEETAYGGRVRQQIGDHVAVGGTYVKDDLDSQSYELTGVDAELRVGKNTRLVGEYATSEGTNSIVNRSDDGGVTYSQIAPSGTQQGDAWKLGLELDVGEWFDKADRYQLGFYHKRLESGFRANGNYLEAGTDKSGLNLSLRLSDRDTVRGKYELVKTDAGVTTAESEEDIGTLQWQHERGRWGLTFEAQSRDQQSPAAADSERTTLAAADVRIDATEDLTVNLKHQQTVSGEKNNQSTLAAKYQLLDNLALQASGTASTEGSSALGGAVLKLGDTEIYVNQRMADDRAGKSATTVVGAQAPIGEHTTVYSEYQWERADSGSKNMSVLGAQRQWEAFKGFEVLLSGEYARTDSEPEDASHLALAGGFSWAHARGIKFSTRAEVRKDTGDADQIQYLTANKLELKLNPDFTLLGTLRWSETRDDDTHEDLAFFTEFNVGLAYRPVRFDRFNALAKYTFLDQMGPQELGQVQAFTSESDVASIEWSLDLTRTLEWVDKLAFKRETEMMGSLPSQTTHTWLWINRLNWNFWRKFDLALEYRIRAQQEAEDRKQGWLTELMWRPAKHFGVGMGYNFTDFSDDEFADNDYSAHGWFIRIQATY